MGGSVVLALCCFGLTTLRFPHITLPEEKVEGVFDLSIESIAPYSSPFQHFILYKGTARSFQGHALSCRIYLPAESHPYYPHKAYRIHGHLKQLGPYAFALKPARKEAWEPLSTATSLAQWRYTLKQSFSQYLKAHISHTGVKTLLYALACGEVEERMLRMDFGKVGLQHILAISGFHFTLLALLLSAFLKLFLPLRPALYTLLIVLGSYAFFLGFSPSILRAFLALLLTLVGQLIGKRSLGPNALGVGLLWTGCVAPLQLLELGFQLSYVCTAAILLFYPPCERALEKLLPKRSFAEALRLQLVDRLGYCLTTLLRTTLALNLAVHLISLPLLLLLFHRFPLLSLAYNLFFPAALTLSIILLFLALLFALWLPPVAQLIHDLNTHWTAYLLHLSTHTPAPYDYILRTNRLTPTFVLIFLACALLIGMKLYHNNKK
jgi:competence protein ComEC